MADSKLSELTAATSVAAADTFYLVQSSTSKGVTAANLFADVATPVSFSDKVSIADADTVTGPGESTAQTMCQSIPKQAQVGNVPMVRVQKVN